MSPSRPQFEKSANQSNHARIEEKWQRYWEAKGTFAMDTASAQDPYYVLVMFPYPSGDKLHMGHWYQYSLVDIWARYKMMLGKDVFQPMGFDAFGLPAENYAIKKGIHPDVSTTRNVAYMIDQYKKMGVAYDWQYMINTSKPEYYRWTQWMFLQLYRKGLAYKKEAPVNWCTSCQTVLANEQVQDGTCERCGSDIIRKNLNQWFFKITDYAQQLLDGIDGLDWPHKTKAMQKNWIGRSEGAEIEFKVKNHDGEPIKVFTTRPDTIFGVTYVTLAPEHPLVPQITLPAQKNAVTAYIDHTGKLSEIDRLSTEKEKTGVFTGAYAVNPLTQEEIPIWISDYVLFSYGTGAVMAVPAHDERDYEFAQKFKLPMKKVILPPGTGEMDLLAKAYTEDGVMINSAAFTGLENNQGKRAVIAELEKTKAGQARITFRLRDWLVSRQRYWGTPIPMTHCNNCGEVPVPEDQLPVKLPENVDFKPTGESPLARCEEFVNTSCPKCKGPAKREVDTLDTFVCSSWYYLRFPSAKIHDKAFDPVITSKFLPVDKYIGGPEHACMHLLYVRFFNMVLHDMGHLDFKEPFQSLTHQGLVLAADGQKMSKSKGNAASPDDYVEKFGADALRMYLAFGFNFVDGGPWDDGGFVAVTRFLDKIQRLFREYGDVFSEKTVLDENALSKADKHLLYVAHHSIKGAFQDTERFMFNTSIARMMEFYNGIHDYVRQAGDQGINRPLLKNILTDFIKLLAPYAPHLSEELWEQSGHQPSIFKQSYPQWQEKYLVPDNIEMAVMVNGKLRGQIEVPKDATEDQVLKIAEDSDKIKKHLEGLAVVKHIFVPGKLVNFIAKPAK